MSDKLWNVENCLNYYCISSRVCIIIQTYVRFMGCKNMDRTASKIITIEELTLLRDYLLLMYMKTMVQKSITDIKLSGNLLAKAYAMLGWLIEDQISKDIKTHKIELKQRGIKMFKEEHSEMVVYFHYTCRGYTDRFGMTRDVMRTEISLKLTKYITMVTRVIKNQIN